MKATPALSLATEAAIRLGSQVAFTATLILAYQRSARVLDLGIISVATLAPSLGFSWGANRLNARLGPLGLLTLGSLVRGVCLGSLAFWGSSLALVAVLTGVGSLCHQAVAAGKLGFDARLVPAADRARFNSKRALIFSLSAMAGPALAGALGAAFGPAVPLLLACGLCGCVAAASRLLRMPAGQTVEKRERAGRLPAGMATLIAAYVLVLVILEMEVPLVLPFVDRVYGDAARLGGMLFSVCGIGSMVGAMALHAWNRPLRDGTVTMLLVGDGLALLGATTSHIWGVTLACFSLLGVISSVAMITVETAVQDRVAAEGQAAVFATLALAGGTGGAAFTLVSSGVADRIGAAATLQGCAWLEVLVGAAATALGRVLG